MSKTTRSGAVVAKDWVRAIQASQRLCTSPHATLAAVVAEQAAVRGGAVALIGPQGQLSYAALAQDANRIARWALAQDLMPGDVVAIMIHNQPAYVALWLGLTQVGCVAALLNTNVREHGLIHCIRSVAARRVIVADSLVQAVAEVRAQLPESIGWWAWGETPAGMQRLDAAVAECSGDPLSEHERRPPALHDPALLIYTSGTTGLPKAAYLSHHRVQEWSGWFCGMMDATAEDRLYDCLPLYHSTGGVVAVGAMLVAGGSVVIRERFSASRFWDDVCQSGCTIFQYIGELCRYLLLSPAQDVETAHRLRLCCGNGLRGDVWPLFQERFHIPRILEFYAATEGRLSLYNCEAKIGAIGRVPPFLGHRFPVALVRIDMETGEPVRDDAGRCIACETGQPGEALAPIGGESRLMVYTDEAATHRKVLHHVFAPGDRWYRTGDLMRKDAAGFYYFVDRLGETFRWKGENVSTAEVASVLALCAGVLDCVVYGVSVPGSEGKAGMAALVVDDTFSWAMFRDHRDRVLPGYARPLFVRLCRSIERTGTFKLSKVSLAKDGYSLGGEPVWYDDKAAGLFVPLDATARGRLAAGLLQL